MARSMLRSLFLMMCMTGFLAGNSACETSTENGSSTLPALKKSYVTVVEALRDYVYGFYDTQKVEKPTPEMETRLADARDRLSSALKLAGLSVPEGNSLGTMADSMRGYLLKHDYVFVPTGALPEQWMLGHISRRRPHVERTFWGTPVEYAVVELDDVSIKGFAAYSIQKGPNQSGPIVSWRETVITLNRPAALDLGRDRFFARLSELRAASNLVKTGEFQDLAQQEDSRTFYEVLKDHLWWQSLQSVSDHPESKRLDAFADRFMDIQELLVAAFIWRPKGEKGPPQTRDDLLDLTKRAYWTLLGHGQAKMALATILAVALKKPDKSGFAVNIRAAESVLDDIPTIVFDNADKFPTLAASGTSPSSIMAGLATAPEPELRRLATLGIQPFLQSSSGRKSR